MRLACTGSGTGVVKADRVIFGYYEPGARPEWGRIGAQAKRQSVEIELSEEPWKIDNETLEARRDAHINGNMFIIDSVFSGLYDAGFQISLPGAWVSGNGPTIAWFVAIECEHTRKCDDNDVDILNSIESLQKEIDEVLNEN